MFRSHSDHPQGARIFLIILKFFKNVNISVVMRQRNIWCVYVRSVWRGMPPAHLSKQSARTHAICYAAASPH